MSLKACGQTQHVLASSRPSTPRPFHLLLVAGLLGLVGCAPDSLGGRVVLSGSSTLAPLGQRVVDAWGPLHPGVETRVEAIGSDAGLERLIRFSDADLALVSRPVTDTDQAEARGVGQTLVTLPLAWDAVALVVPTSNSWVYSLTRDQAVRAFSTARLWSDVDSSWPQTPLHRFVLGPRSGTADVFSRELFGENRDALYIPPVQASEDDDILTRGVTEVEGSLGFLGWSTARRSSGLRVLAFEGVAPSAQTILDRTYPLVRPLWLVATTETLARPEVASLVNYLYQNYSALTADTGLVGLEDPEALVRARLR